MSVEDIPHPLQQFIRAHFTSVHQLEILLALHQDPEKDFSAEEISRRFYVTPDYAAAQLAGLLKSGLLVKDSAGSRFRFVAVPPSKELVAAVGELYSQRRASVITLIYSRPHSDIQAFSDAFRLRKKE